MERKITIFRIVSMILTLLVGVVCLGFFSLSYPQAKAYVDALILDGSLDSLTPERFDLIGQPVRIFGAVFIAFGLALLLMPERTSDWLRRLILWIRAKSTVFWQDARVMVKAIRGVNPGKWTIVALLILILVATGIRWVSIGRAMGHDEAYTFEAFASHPLGQVVTDYHLPNNHVFHTILVHISFKIFGDAPWAVRLPAFLAGILLVPLAYWVGKRLFSWPAGLASASLAVVAPVMVSYATNARGYTLLALITLLSWALGIYLKAQKNRFGWFLLSLLWALGFYTLPIMLYPFGMLWVWLFISGWVKDLGEAYASPWEMTRYLVVFGLLAALMAVLLYTPIFISSGLASFTNNSFVQPLGWSEFWQTLPHRLEDTWLEWNDGMPGLGYFLLIGLGFSLFLHTRISRHKVPLQLIALLWLAATFIAMRPNPWAKVWVYLFVPACIWACAGWLGIFQRIHLPRQPQRNLAQVLAVLVMLAAVVFGAARAIQIYPEHSSPKEIEKTAIYLKSQITPEDVILFDYPWDVTFWYYARRYGLPGSAVFPEAGVDFQRVFVVVSPGYGQTVNSVLTSNQKTGITCAFNTVKLVQKIDDTFIYGCEK